MIRIVIKKHFNPNELEQGSDYSDHFGKLGRFRVAALEYVGCPINKVQKYTG